MAIQFSADGTTVWHKLKMKYSLEIPQNSYQYLLFSFGLLSESGTFNQLNINFQCYSQTPIINKKRSLNYD